MYLVAVEVYYFAGRTQYVGKSANYDTTRIINGNLLHKGG